MGARQRPRVAMCALTFGVGGAEIQALRLAAALRTEFEITLFVGRPVDEDIEIPPWLSVRPVVSTAARRDRLTSAWRLVDACRESRPDLIYSTYVNFNLALARARGAGRLPCPVILQEVIEPSSCYRGSLLLRVYGRLLRRYYPRADFVLANSSIMREDLVENFSVPGERCRYLPYLVPEELLERFAPSASGRWAVLPSAESPLRLLAVGRLFPQKAYPDLLRAFARIRREVPHSRLTILGEGPLRESLAALAAELGVAEQVRFAGHVRDPVPFYAEADVFVLSSHFEGMANVLIEAMAAGLPIVATDVSGTGDLIPSPEIGVVVPVGEPETFAEAVVGLAADPERRQRIGDAARERVRSFCGAEIAPHYAEIFHSLCAGEPAGNR